MTIKKNCVSKAFLVAWTLHNMGGFKWDEIRAAFSKSVDGTSHVWIEGFVFGEWRAFSEHGMDEIWMSDGVTNGQPTDHWLTIEDFVKQQWDVMPKEKAP